MQRARQAHGAGRATHDGSACRPPAMLDQDASGFPARCGSLTLSAPSDRALRVRRERHFELGARVAGSLAPDAFRPAAVHPLRPAADRPLTVGVGELIAETALHRVELKRVLAFGLTTRRHLSTRAAAGQARASSVRISFKRRCGKHGFRT